MAPNPHDMQQAMQFQDNITQQKGPDAAMTARALFAGRSTTSSLRFAPAVTFDAGVNRFTFTFRPFVTTDGLSVRILERFVDQAAHDLVPTLPPEAPVARVRRDRRVYRARRDRRVHRVRRDRRAQRARPRDP